VPEVRVVTDSGEALGIMSTRDAQKKADSMGYDLVEISPNAKPPVCKITDYGKHKYNLDKKQKMAKKNQTVIKLKEIKYHANVEEHDYQTKLRHCKEFLEAGNRLKCSLFFRGRENSHRDLGVKLFNRIISDLEALCHVDSPPKIAGRSLAMMLSPLNTQQRIAKEKEIRLREAAASEKED